MKLYNVRRCVLLQQIRSSSCPTIPSRNCVCLLLARCIMGQNQFSFTTKLHFCRYQVRRTAAQTSSLIKTLRICIAFTFFPVAVLVQLEQLPGPSKGRCHNPLPYRHYLPESHICCFKDEFVIRRFIS